MGGRPDFGLRQDFGFRPKLGPQEADLSNFGTKMRSATRRAFWDASQRRPAGAIQRPKRPKSAAPCGFSPGWSGVPNLEFSLFLSKRVPGGVRPLPPVP